MRIVVLGAGFGGLELTARLSEALGEEAEIVLVDRADSFVFGFSKLDVMFGRTTADHVCHPYRNLVKPGVRFVRTEVRSIDPQSRRVDTDDGYLDADVLVVALGADLDPSATPGLVEAGYEFYTVTGAFALRHELAKFAGGRVVVAVCSTPFKCPPAPSETALLVHDYLVGRGLRERCEIDLLMPMGAPIPPSPAASAALRAAFAERGIGWHPDAVIRELDAGRSAAVLADGTEVPFDLFLGVPRHRAPLVVRNSPLSVDGWIPVDPLTLETGFSDVYAIGDVTSVGTPKAGVFAEGQAAVVAERIIAMHRDVECTGTYGGRGTCYVEFGAEQVARVNVTFLPGRPPSGDFDAPDTSWAAEKTEFGASRVWRWFGREWTNL